MLQWAKQLLAKGNKVLACCRDPAKASELSKVGVAEVLKLDVSDPASIQAWAAELAKHADHIDVSLKPDPSKLLNRSHCSTALTLRPILA